MQTNDKGKKEFWQQLVSAAAATVTTLQVSSLQQLRASYKTAAAAAAAPAAVAAAVGAAAQGHSAYAYLLRSKSLGVFSKASPSPLVPSQPVQAVLRES